MSNKPKEKPVNYPLSGDGSPATEAYRNRVRSGEIKKVGRPFSTPEQKAESKRKRKEYQQNYYVRKKSRIRRKVDNFLPFEEAREKIQNEALESVNQYKEWFYINRPSNLPVDPRVFYRDKGWISWNDFLGTNNTYPYIKRKAYRPYKEARAFAMSKNIGGFMEWLEFCKAGKCPADIPHRPDIAYFNRGEWFSWREFLGPKNVIEKRKAVEEFDEKVLYILNVPDKTNSKLYRIGLTVGGRSAIRESCLKYQLRYVDAYVIDRDYDWKRILMRFGEPHWAGEGVYEVGNISEFINTVAQSFSRYSMADNTV